MAGRQAYWAGPAIAAQPWGRLIRVHPGEHTSIFLSPVVFAGGSALGMRRQAVGIGQGCVRTSSGDGRRNRAFSRQRSSLIAAWPADASASTATASETKSTKNCEMLQFATK